MRFHRLWGTGTPPWRVRNVGTLAAFKKLAFQHFESDPPSAKLQRDRIHIFFPAGFFQCVFICFILCLYFAVWFFMLLKVLLLFFVSYETDHEFVTQRLSEYSKKLQPWERCCFGWPRESFWTRCWQQWRGTRTDRTCSSKKGRTLECHRQVRLTISGAEDVSVVYVQTRYFDHVSETSFASIV